MKKMLRYLGVLALALAVACSCAACSTNSAPATAPQAGAGTEDEWPALTLKLSTSDSDTGIATITANYFAGLVSEATGGKVEIKIFPNCQLAGGDQSKSIQLLVAGGNYELGVFSGSVMGNMDERLLTHQIPFIFQSYAEASEKMDTTGGAYYTKLLADKGITYMAGLHNGMRQLSNSKKVVDSPDDLVGMKIRVPSGEVYMKMMSEFGADPVAMTWTEVFTSLQQGTIDGQENGYMTTASANIQEVQDYITEWNWSYDGFWIMANTNDFAKLPEKVQALLMEKSQEAALWGRAKLEADEDGIKQSFIDDYGVTVTELTDEQFAAFVEKARPVQEYFIEKFGAEACAAWGLE